MPAAWCTLHRAGKQLLCFDVKSSTFCVLARMYPRRWNLQSAAVPRASCSAGWDQVWYFCRGVEVCNLAAGLVQLRVITDPWQKPSLRFHGMFYFCWNTVVARQWLQ